MSVSTNPDNVRIVDDVDDGGKAHRRARARVVWLGVLAGSTVGLVVGAGAGGAAWSLVPALVVTGALAGHDLVDWRLPDRGIVAVAVLGLAASMAWWSGAGLVPWATGSLVAGLPLLTVHLVSPCSMGFGDVKFAATLGGLVGVAGTDLGDRVYLAMVALTVAGATAALGAVGTRRHDVAFGPSLFVGTAAVLAFAALTRSSPS